MGANSQRSFPREGSAASIGRGIAALAEALASDEATLLTGQSLVIDGVSVREVPAFKPRK